MIQQPTKSSLRDDFLFPPPAADSFDQLHGGDLALADELGVRALSLQSFAAGVHDFEIAHDAGTITFGSQFGRPFGVLDGALLRRGLVAQKTDARQASLDVAEGN